MKTLHLLRHAKSRGKKSAPDDHERPLSKRGLAAAKAVAIDLRRAKVAPDLVICSTARRARQTLDAIAASIKAPRVILEEKLYNAAQERLWKQIRKLPESAKCVLLIGHNPGLHELALALADAGSGKQIPARGAKFPPGAMASFRFGGAWQEVHPHGAVLLSYTRAKEQGSKTEVERPVKPAASGHRNIGKAAVEESSVRPTAKAKEPDAKTTVPRTTKTAVRKARPKRVAASGKARPGVVSGLPGVAARPAAATAPVHVPPPAPAVRPATPIAARQEPASAAASSPTAAPPTTDVKPPPR